MSPASQNSPPSSPRTALIVGAAVVVVLLALVVAIVAGGGDDDTVGVAAALAGAAAYTYEVPVVLDGVAPADTYVDGMVAAVNAGAAFGLWTGWLIGAVVALATRRAPVVAGRPARRGVPPWRPPTSAASSEPPPPWWAPTYAADAGLRPGPTAFPPSGLGKPVVAGAGEQAVSHHLSTASGDPHPSDPDATRPVGLPPDLAEPADRRRRRPGRRADGRARPTPTPRRPCPPSRAAPTPPPSCRTPTRVASEPSARSAPSSDVARRASTPRGRLAGRRPTTSGCSRSCGPDTRRRPGPGARGLPGDRRALGRRRRRPAAGAARATAACRCPRCRGSAAAGRASAATTSWSRRAAASSPARGSPARSWRRPGRPSPARPRTSSRSAGGPARSRRTRRS